ncbi:transmembrane protein 220 isoform X2 [Lingula anatina]|uniref:Transmembrane protein 220 isoform X2 n=1 Tax=Lingula anatina TaxID=7574 RepID=A0A2R2MKU5_LINAN|nr:transmembrane protein 220 isoform X2 [Lingula anatina]|eukprot:XP_023930682.1 transmembrane protein 220 isoform X2 [Lingula anatina]
MTKPQDVEESSMEGTGSAGWQKAWQAINVVAAVFFALAAYVQINDPDPYIWIPIYFIPTLLCLTIAIKPILVENTAWRNVCVIHMAICLTGTLYLTVTVLEMTLSTRVNPLQHEEGRELGGLILVMAWLAILRFSGIGSKSGSGHMGALLLLTATLSFAPLVFWGLCFMGDWPQHSLSHCKGMFPA